jgi:hypothetical protein
MRHACSARDPGMPSIDSVCTSFAPSRTCLLTRLRRLSSFSPEIRHKNSAFHAFSRLFTEFHGKNEKKLFLSPKPASDFHQRRDATGTSHGTGQNSKNINVYRPWDDGTGPEGDRSVGASPQPSNLNSCPNIKLPKTLSNFIKLKKRNPLFPESAPMAISLDITSNKKFPIHQSFWPSPTSLPSRPPRVTKFKRHTCVSNLSLLCLLTVSMCLQKAALRGKEPQ